MDAVRFLTTLLVVMLVLFAVPEAMASDAACEEMFANPIRAMMSIFTGPVALALAMVGFIICGVALIFGGELQQFIKQMFTVVLVGCVLVGSASVANVVFGLDVSSIADAAGTQITDTDDALCIQPYSS